MGDPVSEIRHLFSRYVDAQRAKDIATLSALHWQDDRFVHVWSPGHTDTGWSSYESTLSREFEQLDEVTFHLSDVNPEVFGGKFAAVTAHWRCGFETAAGRKGISEGPVTFVLARMGNSWKIVADHFSVA